MELNLLRLKSAGKAMGCHFGASVLVAMAVATLVFAVWFPYPYRKLAGGTELFYLVMGVDLVCGPLLTLVLYNPAKPKRELVMDLSLVVVLQLAALVYGIWTVHVARPLYLVHEFDRFKVIALVDVDAQELAKLPTELRPKFFSGPLTVGLRVATPQEQNIVMLESVQGGRDYGERPSFYANYDGVKASQKARPVSDFVKKHPERRDEINKMVDDSGVSSVAQDGNQWRYLPIIARKDWVAILDSKGKILTFIKGDGF